MLRSMKRLTARRTFLFLRIRKGDRVALHLDNCPEFIFCWFGLAKSAPLWCRLMPAYWAKKAHGSCKTAVSLLVTSAQFYPMYREIRRDNSTPLNHICLIGEQLPADDGVSHFTQLQSASPPRCAIRPRYPLTIRRKFCLPPVPPRVQRVVITHYNLRFAGYYSAGKSPCAMMTCT